MDVVWLVVAAAVVLLGLYASSVRVLKEDERVVVLRIGKAVGVSGPGRVFLLPILDKGVPVNLSERIPGWRGMAKAELDRQVMDIALRDSRRS